MNVEPGHLEFSTVDAGDTETLTVMVTNCGELHPFEVDAHLATAQEMDDESVGDYTLLDADTLPATLEADESLSLDVKYAPEGDEWEQGYLTITNDSEQTDTVQLVTQGQQADDNEGPARPGENQWDNNGEEYNANDSANDTDPDEGDQGGDGPEEGD